MTLRFNLRASQLMLTFAALFVCGLAGTTDAVSQRLPKATGRQSENKSAPARRERRKQNQSRQPESRTPASIESNNFLDLGDRFREQEKWKAAEAAYKEALKVWPGNVDALVELGFLYIDRNRMDEAQQTYSNLRSLNPSYASDLLAEINKHKATLIH